MPRGVRRFPRPAGWVNPLKGKKRGPRGTLAERFWSKVQRGAADACWPWLGSKDQRGYGFLWTGERNERAHRVSLQLAGVDLPPYSPQGLVVDHKCHNTSCVNPAHLRIVPQEDNCTTLAGKLGPFGRNRLATHCPQGHAYSPENTALTLKRRDGKTRYGRICLTCFPTYWRHAMIPRPRPPGSRIKKGDPDFPVVHARGGV